VPFVVENDATEKIKSLSVNRGNKVLNISASRRLLLF